MCAPNRQIKNCQLHYYGEIAKIKHHQYSAIWYLWFGFDKYFWKFPLLEVIVSQNVHCISGFISIGKNGWLIPLKKWYKGSTCNQSMFLPCVSLIKLQHNLRIARYKSFLTNKVVHKNYSTWLTVNHCLINP